MTAKLEILIIKKAIHLLHLSYCYSKALHLVTLKTDNKHILLEIYRLRNTRNSIVFQLKKYPNKSPYNLACNILWDFLQIPLQIRLQAISMQFCRITLIITMLISRCRRITTTIAKTTIALTATVILRTITLFLLKLIQNGIEMLLLI